MRINAINSAMLVQACQPIKPEFNKQSFKSTKAVDTDAFDTAEPQDPKTLEQKYDFACRLAAYYKTKYDQLLKNGGVVV